MAITDLNTSKKSVCGIYAIEHRVNGTRYIGASKNTQRRWWQHRNELRQGKHACWRLQDAWTADGEDAFTFVVIEVCTPDQLPQRETHYQRFLGEVYNTRQTRAYPVLTGAQLQAAVESWRPKRSQHIQSRYRREI